jgi:hypothetical protein
MKLAIMRLMENGELNFHQLFVGHKINKFRVLYHICTAQDKSAPSSIACLGPNTLADLSQLFSILSDLKCYYRSAFSCYTNHL